MVGRIVTGAHYGVRDWLMQRVTAVVMVVYTLLLVGIFLKNPAMQYADWKALFSNNAMRLITLLFWFSLFLHAWIGMRDIFMDYIKHTGARLFFEVLVILALVAYAAWAIQILWSA